MLKIRNLSESNINVPVQLSPLIIPSPVSPGGQRQMNPDGELTQVALDVQSATVEHSSTTAIAKHNNFYYVETGLG